MTLAFVKTAPGEDPIIIEGYFAATPARVFEAWTVADEVMKWFGHSPNSLYSAHIDLRPGGAWQFVMSRDDQKSMGFEGEYVAIDPDRRLVFTWSHVVVHANNVRDATPPSQVEVTFTANGDGTDLRLVHSAVQDDETRMRFGGGWNAAMGVLSELFSNA